ncbi:hypothetical protein CEXT_57091 [Caerostris extrusa]|uniref:Uncharacterized protein n=1 Tax=Caerostris extrusa TaxID=172846 RepID=A0AAV4RA61_CAEEX|nr:hypothetical protein CEXT_57091 [Caerostris extrusa]
MDSEHILKSRLAKHWPIRKDSDFITLSPLCTLRAHFYLYVIFDVINSIAVAETGQQLTPKLVYGPCSRCVKRISKTKNFFIR